MEVIVIIGAISFKMILVLWIIQFLAEFLISEPQEKTGLDHMCETSNTLRKMHATPTRVLTRQRNPLKSY